jgi:type IX secretion system PorP/SprF family membrane protein
MMIYLKISINQMFRKYFGYILFMLSAHSLNAQQASLTTQYDVVSGIQNPAYNGMHQSLRIDAISRIQWANFPGTPRYTCLGIQTPLSKDFALGANFQSLKVGSFKVASPLTMNVIAGDIAYHKQVSKNVNVAVGLRLGIFGFNMQLSSLVADNPTDVAIGGNDYNINTPVIGGGVIIYGKNYYIGGAMPQYALLSDQIIDNVNIGYNARTFYLLNAGYIIPLNSKWNFKTTIQTRYYYGLPMQFDFNGYLIDKDLFSIGYGYRSTGSHAVLSSIKVNEFFKVLYSYENGTVYNKNIPFVSHEFGLSYSFSQPSKQTKVVPRFY